MAVLASEVELAVGRMIVLRQEAKQYITRGFEQLGPERVARALKYHRDHSWAGCFLAMAYGDVGALSKLLQMTGAGQAPGVQVAVILGMDPQSVSAIVSWYDSEFLCPGLLRLAEEWLEQNRRPGKWEGLAGWWRDEAECCGPCR